MQSTMPHGPQLRPHLPGGLVPRLWARLFGSDAARLKERLQPAHWLSYVLIIAQSATVLLVFGHAEIPLLVAASLAVRLIAGLGIFVLVASVFAADMAMLATLKRIPALARNRQRWQLREHVAYTLFVLATEAVTLAVVLAALDATPGELISPQPLIVPGSALFQAAIALRVLLVSWSAVQLVIVRGRLPVLLSTLTATGREIVGAHVERKLAQLDIEGISLPAAFGTYAAMSKPPRRVRTVWNGWLVRRDAAAEAEEARQVANVIDALDELEARTLSLAHPPLPAPVLPPEPPPAPAPSAPQDGEAEAEGPQGPPSRATMRLVPTGRNRNRNQAQRRTASPGRSARSEAELRAMAYGLLDANPALTRAQLRNKLGIRQERANALHTGWQLDRQLDRQRERTIGTLGTRRRAQAAQ